MSRVIHTDSTGKNRNRHMRTCAEILRHLSQKSAIDDETKDMAALLVYSLREIENGIDNSEAVWEKRDYWMKAEKLRQRWDWVAQSAQNLERIVRDDQWLELPQQMVTLLPHFADVKITRFTRTADLWEGAYKRLISDLA